jgi:carboxylate-amine ligase
VLAENRFLAARDGVGAELIDPVTETMVPVARILADLLAAAAPHAAALGAGDELAKVPAIFAEPEAARQEALAASEGIEALVADLAARFDVGAPAPRSSGTRAADPKEPRRRMTRRG